LCIFYPKILSGIICSGGQTNSAESRSDLWEYAIGLNNLIRKVDGIKPGN
jgi:hypothetical protein